MTREPDVGGGETRRIVRSRWPRMLLRLLAFNLLLVFVPVAGVLYLGAYETQLLRWQERSMVQQARLVAAALAGSDAPTAERAEELLTNLRQRTESRIRVLDAEALLLADSSRLGPQRAALEDGESAVPEAEVRSRFLYQFGAKLVGAYRRVATKPSPALGAAADFYSPDEPFRGSEVAAALEGRYGAQTRVSAGGQRSVTLYSAIPIEHEGEIRGAVLVSQSTFRILTTLYDIRLALFKVFLASVVAAVVLSLILSATIAGPVNRLRNEAATLLDRHGRLQGEFSGSSRRDEIGDLARALQELSSRLRRHLDSVEGFATDLSHELKNPLASIRNAANLLAQSEDDAERARFLDLLERDVARMQHLVNQVRDVSRIEAQTEAEERRSVRLDELLVQLVEGVRLRLDGSPEHEGIEITWTKPIAVSEREEESGATVLATPERLAQVFENLLDNAVTFSERGDAIEVHLTAGRETHTVVVRDEGPGIAAGDLPRLFDRFFTARPEKGANQHTGLGLAIVKAIVESHGGTVRAENRAGGGAEFVVELPAAGR